MSPRSSIGKADVEIVDKHSGHLEHVPNVLEIDNFRVCGLDVDDADFYTSFPPERRKKVFRKVQ